MPIIETAVPIDIQGNSVAKEDLSTTSIPICDTGTMINVHILQGKPVPSALTEQMHRERSTYWINHHPTDLPQRASEWNNDFQNTLGLATALRDSSDLSRSVYWSNANIRVLTDAQNSGIPLSNQLKEAQQLHRDALELSSTLPPDTTGVTLERLVSSPHEYGLQTGMEVDKYIFLVRSKHGMLPAEVNATSFHLNDPKKRHTVYCGLISVGCPAGCTMCDIGEFSAGQLSADQMAKMVLTPMLIAGFPKQNPDRARISWLGGGDPAFNIPEFTKAVGRVNQYFPISTQVVSTVGVSEKSLDHLLRLRETIPQVSLQVSILDLDPAVRQSFIRTRVLPPTEALKILSADWRNTGRKSYLSFMLYEGLNDDPERIGNMLQELQVDPASVHVTLDLPNHVRDTQLQPATLQTYEASLKHLSDKGYESHIYQTPQSAEFTTGCGVLSLDTRSRISAATLFQRTESDQKTIQVYSAE